ncbi:MAG: FKBP-type peptidyl-prolyl cis-trans isomerase [Desulfurivibrionaceae bacterium]|nr:FKBP-type peptidyl-prolyl cis-trans isomerase [Desulfobulbales bacterium]MDT8334478.1 FKBP-type peptidyl-prolyl cis-trans isomerase [Desulfurivibrionaceae bacterium]
MKKKIIVTLALCLFMAGPFACSKTPEEEGKNVELDTFANEISYVVGQDIGSSLREIKSEINAAALFAGIDDSLNGREPRIGLEQAEALKQEFTRKLQQEFAARAEEAAGRNLAEGETFLAENKGKEGVVTTESGLQYIVVAEGDGPVPGKTDTVKVHYRGTLIDGTEFDSSYARGEAAVFQVGAVIPGWTEALQLMKVGSKYQLFLPPDLAYGEKQVSQEIGPNSTLIFDVELVGIE